MKTLDTRQDRIVARKLRDRDRRQKREQRRAQKRRTTTGRSRKPLGGWRLAAVKTSKR